MITLLKQSKIQIVFMLVITALAYSNIFQNEFVIDDKTFIVNWEQSRNLNNLGEFFKGVLPTGHEGVYRPIRSVFYALYYQLWQTNPFFYHLHSLLVHLLSVILVYSILEALFKKKQQAFLGGLFFGLHPIHTESISYVSASMEMTGVVFFLTSFYFYLKSKKITSIFFAFLAFFTYEMTLILPVLILLHEICLSNIQYSTFKTYNFKLLIKRFLPYFFIAVFYFFVRFFLLNITSRGSFLAGSFYLTFLASTKVFFKYLVLSVFPWNQAHNHMISSKIEAILYRGHNLEPIISQSFLDLDVLFSIFTIVFLFFLFFKTLKKYPLISFGLGWFFIALLPVYNIVPQWSLMHEKFLYAPSLGIIIVFVYLFGKLISYKKNFVLFLLPVFLTFFILTFLRNTQWKNAISFWSSDIKTAPKANAYAYFQLGEAYYQKNEKVKAAEFYKKAFEINPYFAVAIASAARIFANQGKVDLAVEDYQKAIKADPNFWEGYLNLANIFKAQGKMDLADRFYKKALKVNPNLVTGNIVNQKRKEYQSKFALSFLYPSDWSVIEENNELRILSEKGNFVIELKKDNIISGISREDYLKTQIEIHGTLINQGLAKIPNVDFAYVKIFSDKGINKMQFFLFKEDKVLEVLVYPSDSALMREFDGIVESIKISNS